MIRLTQWCAATALMVSAISPAQAASFRQTLADDPSGSFKSCVKQAVYAYASAEMNYTGPKTFDPVRSTGKLVCEADTVLSKVEINSSVTKSSAYYKVPQDGSANTTLGFACYGDDAKRLFDDMYRFSQDGRSRWSDGAIVDSRKVGDIGCYRRIQDANGLATDYTWCIFNLNVYSSFLQALNL